MRLSIITINYNNAEGLKQTLDSVACQTIATLPSSHLATSPIELEHIIIDGGSTDGSVDVIRDYESSISNKQSSIRLHWISERDKGIYNAMNKGIRMASGEYLLFLNSGDCLMNEGILAKVFEQQFNEDVVYGHLQYECPDKTYVNHAPETVTLRTFIHGTIYHSGAAFIRRDAFERFGYYDESLKIVSDWKWFLQHVGLGTATTLMLDMVLSRYDGSGVSETQLERVRAERQQVLEELVPLRVMQDLEEIERLEKELVIQARQIRSTRAYRLGERLLAPVKKLNAWKK